MKYLINKDDHLSDLELSQLKSSLLGPLTRDQLMIAISLYTGCRSAELLSLTTNSLSGESCSISLIGAKRSYDRELPLPPHIWSQLVRYSSTVDKGAKLFQVKSRQVINIWHKLRPAGCTKPEKSLRHTFAINLYKMTKDIMLVKQALGHVSIANTMVYATYVYSKEEMKRILPLYQDESA